VSRVVPVKLLAPFLNLNAGELCGLLAEDAERLLAAGLAEPHQLEATPVADALAALEAEPTPESPAHVADVAPVAPGPVSTESAAALVKSMEDPSTPAPKATRRARR
jgi:hypothetical protein